mgnify:CR=1 FL=1
MTRRNDKRNNNSELNSFAKILLGALLGKGAGMITEVLMKKAEEKTEDKPHTVIRQSDNLLESSCIINGDGSAIEIPIPDGFQIFISEDGKPMIRKKIEGDEKKNKTPDAAENVAITYDDISKKLFLNKKIFFILGKYIDSGTAHDENYDDSDNCTSEAQAKRMAAFNKLQNIAKYLNDGWKPDFKGSTRNWFISKKRGEEYRVIFTYSDNAEIVFFKSACLAKEAIRLMGEESLNDLFSTDW